MGAPVPLDQAPPARPATTVTDAQVTRTSGLFTSPSIVARSQAPDIPPSGTFTPPPVPPPSYSTTPLPQPNTPPICPPSPGLPPPPTTPLLSDQPFDSGVVAGPPPGTAGGFNSSILVGSTGRGMFQSDHAFDGFISPVTSPFLFEDPRALTEVRPIFIYQSIPNRNFIFQGGSAEFIGAQARLAITDRWSFVMNKLGWFGVQPNNPFLSNESVFADIDLGPKWTFLRNDCSGTLGALGLTFQIPTGTTRFNQNHGSLALIPYLSMGQNFWRTSYGSMNFLGSLAYSFSTENNNRDYLSTNLHLDYDVANLHKFYPLMELNWLHYPQQGSINFVNVQDNSINFGSFSMNGHDVVDLSFGARYKFSECFQVGSAIGFPVSGGQRLNDFRITVDMIFRY
jgi:hypothetical protein